MRYNQIRAMLAISLASLRSQIKSPTSLIFGIFFPLTFIFVFGYLGNGVPGKYEVAITRGSDTHNTIYNALLRDTSFSVTTGLSDDSLDLLLSKKEITSIISIESADPSQPLLVKVRFNAAQGNTAGSIMARLAALQNKDRFGIYSEGVKVAQIIPEVSDHRTFEAIDFVLPGQLGFSIMSLAIFGTAFTFFLLRNTLVLKRFFATPIRRHYIILGEALSRLGFQVATAAVIIIMGHYIFSFTLMHGVVTVLNMLLVSALGFLVFMGFGYVISGIAKTDSIIPVLANSITLPQMLLSGTFFPVESFPKWIQPICNVLPLTHLNNALRQIAYDGASLVDVWQPVGILVLWGIIVYALASRLFRWE